MAQYTTTTPTDACETVGKFLAILKNQATHESAMPDAPLRDFRVFAACIDETITLCATEAPTVDDCREIEAFLSDVAVALLDGDLFPEAPHFWKQGFIDAIEVAGMACAAVTHSLDEVGDCASVTVH